MLKILFLAVILINISCGNSSASQSLNLQSVGNARELGGYRTLDDKIIKHGVLLRTASLSNMTSQDIRKLAQDYNLAVILDFRIDFEAKSEPDPVIDGVENVKISIIDFDMNSPQAQKMLPYLAGNDKVSMLIGAVKTGYMTKNLYVDILSSKSGRDGYRIMFEKLLALPENKSLLFHCTQGKDRTGLAAMLILSALNVDENIIMSDYLLTNEFNAGKIAREREFAKTIMQDPDEQELLLLTMDYVSPELMNNALNYIKSNYGSVMNYINNELGINDEQINLLREKFLTR
ncbi:MAG: tyrosine-protein phosphatase [Synergistaceae bacterium]|nr:tyrosine-protein phosphatase [Synergistaceae bacterium]